MKNSFQTSERPVQDVKPNTMLNGENCDEQINLGTLHGGEEITPGTLHGEEEIKPGTLHAGEEIKPGTLHGGEEITPGTLHAGEEIKPGTLHGGEEIKPGTLHSGGEEIKSGTLCAGYTPAIYRTKDGNSYYKFSYVDIGGKFEIDILEQPSYRSRDVSASSTHRLPSARNGQKICISSGSEPTSIEGAKNISVQWAELTETYIRTGQSIDDQVAQAAV
jgi:hypothetical protein